MVITDPAKISRWIDPIIRLVWFVFEKVNVFVSSILSRYDPLRIDESSATRNRTPINRLEFITTLFLSFVLYNWVRSSIRFAEKN